jgi:hypothetical protein
MSRDQLCCLCGEKNYMFNVCSYFSVGKRDKQGAGTESTLSQKTSQSKLINYIIVSLRACN